MNTQDTLRDLAQADIPVPPFGFEEFERRRDAAVTRRRAALRGVAGSVAALGLIVVMAVVTQAPPRLPATAVPVLQSAVGHAPDLPALVNLDQLDVTAELEDHIALLDAELSAARVHAAPAARLRQLENTREQLNESLQRVSYAHSLLSL